MILVFTGIQWSGKGTQARLLSQKHNVKILEMWWEFRRVTSSGSELWETIKSIMERWDQVNEYYGKQVMQDAISTTLADYNPETDIIIFDGFIRNEWNKEIFDRLLPDYRVVLFDLSEEKAKQRLLGRKFNPSTWETFPSGTEVDPNTWEELITRSDDNEQGILKRIDLYRDITLPIVEKQQQEGKVIEINADQTPEDVFAEVQKKLEL